MGKYKIVFEREACIGNGVCAALASKTWETPYSEVHGGDGKAKLLKEEFNQEEFQENFAAAEQCPVNVIHIVDKETGKQLI